MSRDTLYASHVLECIRRLEENTSAGYGAFIASHTLQDAVLRNVQTMSEATQRLSPEIKARYPDVPWAEIAAFRNVVVHNYLGIDLRLVWSVVQQDVPELKRAMVNIQEELRQLPN